MSQEEVYNFLIKSKKKGLTSRQIATACNLGKTTVNCNLRRLYVGKFVYLRIKKDKIGGIPTYLYYIRKSKVRK